MAWPPNDHAKELLRTIDGCISHNHTGRACLWVLWLLHASRVANTSEGLFKDFTWVKIRICEYIGLACLPMSHEDAQNRRNQTVKEEAYARESRPENAEKD